MVKWGMTPAQALQTSFMTVANVLNYDWATRVGSLEKGKFADIIAVAGNPLNDVTEMERVKFVMKGGMVMKNEFRLGPRRQRPNSARTKGKVLMPRRSKPSNAGGPTRRQLLYGVAVGPRRHGLSSALSEAAGVRSDRGHPGSGADGKRISDVMARLSTYMSRRAIVRCPNACSNKRSGTCSTRSPRWSRDPSWLRAAPRPRSREPTAGRKWRRSLATRSCADRWRRRWRTACWRTPTRPTTRGRAAGIRAVTSCPRRGRRASSSASAARTSCAPWRSATTSARAS